MLAASQLRTGMVIRYENQAFRVISCDYRAGQGKMGGVAHVRLKNLATGSFWEHSLRADLKLEILDVERHNLEFLYSDADQYYFMNPETFDQIGIPAQIIGSVGRFLQPQMQLPVEFVDGKPMNVVFPDIVELRVESTAPPAHQQQDTTWKIAEMENGLKIMVPQFIKSGDMVRIEVEKLRYVDRARPGAR